MPGSSPTAFSGRDRILISACLALVCALAWLYLFHLDRQMSVSMAYDTMMADMGMSMDKPWTTTDVLLTFAMWAVMMVGMMAPSAAPVLLLVAARPGPRKTVLMFALGYVFVWVGFSAVAALAQWVLHEMAMLSPAMAASSPYLAGAILIVAGAYQLTPWKGACLTHCRSPVEFLMTHWRDGAKGAFEMGRHHGTYCLGCCWALMYVLFVVGVMNLMWVAALTALVLLEKVGPAGTLIARLAGAAMLVAGIARIVAAT